jgi:hypothetical protein
VALTIWHSSNLCVQHFVCAHQAIIGVDGNVEQAQAGIDAAILVSADLYQLLRIGGTGNQTQLPKTPRCLCSLVGHGEEHASGSPRTVAHALSSNSAEFRGYSWLAANLDIGQKMGSAQRGEKLDWGPWELG